MNTVHYSRCPVCDSSRVDPLFTAKDHSVSKQQFVIWQCRDCSLRFTQDVPDEDSIGSYYQSEDYISHSNTKKGLINSLYQSVRNYTLDQKASLIIQHTKKNGRLLDLGAGTGAFLNTMKQKGWEVTGIEPDARARKEARSLHSLELQEKDALHEFERNAFDAITLWHVLEHVHSLHEYIRLLKELLKPGGKIFIAVPNYTSVDSDVYKLFWAAYDVPRHLYHFTPAAMQALVQRHGLKIVAKKPMWFDSFYISLLSSKYKNGKTRWLGAGIRGLRSNITALFNKDRCSSLIYIIDKA